MTGVALTEPKQAHAQAAAPAPKRHLLWLAAGAAFAAALSLVLIRPTSAPNVPGAGSVEVGFARDMSAHHMQAVEMAELIRDRTDDPSVRILAIDISRTQQAQVGQMRGWLDVWGHRPIDMGPSMAWMDHPTDGLMPGMASQEDINRLRRSRGEAADELFLTLMLDHHRAGVIMAEAALDRTEEPVVLRLAQAIAASQTSEQNVLREMLAELEQGAPGASDEPAHPEDEH